MTVLARLPLTYAQRDGGRSHAPMVVVALGGAERRLILDTGSEVHLLTDTLARELGLAMAPGEEGTDHSGATLASWSVGEVALRLGDAELTLRDVVAIEAPAAFAERGIDGILSPQFLHDDAYAVIDTANERLSLVAAADEGVREYVQSEAPGLAVLSLDRDPAFPTPVVSAAIDGYGAVGTLLNTGGRSTEYSAAAVPGLSDEAAAGERLGGGVGGSDYSGVKVGRRTLVVGGHRLTVSSLAVRERMHDPQGIVGMDVLHGTVLAVAGDAKRPVFWAVRSSSTD